MRARGVLMLGFPLLLASACGSGVSCLQPDPPALLLYVSSAQTGQRLDNLSGTVTSRGETDSLACFPVNGLEECDGWAYGSSATVHVERAGFMPWDSGPVRIDYTSTDCPAVILKKLNIQLTPQ